MRNPVRLIVNPAAGGGRGGRSEPAVRQRLERAGVLAGVELTRDIEHARELADAASARGELLAVLGGDGLIGAVADVARRHEGATLALLPGGSGNDLARVLQIPFDPLAACDVLLTGQRVPLDLGEVRAPGASSGRAFVGIASFGFDSDANRMANEAPRRLGRLVYAYGALAALRSWRPARFELTVDGRHLTFTGYSVAAASSKAYGGGMYVAPDARLDDGQLDVIYLEQMGKARFLTMVLPRVFKGNHVKDRAVHTLRGAELSFDADRPFAVYADGDPIGHLPASIVALPAAVGVLVPASIAAHWRR